MSGKPRLVGVLVFLTLTGSVAACGDVTCANSVLQDLPSPDGHRHLIVFKRDCGATTSVSTQASILTSSRGLPVGSGNVFVSDHGDVGGEWIDAHTVKISYSAGTRIFKQVKRHDDTDVRYSAPAR